MRTRGLERDLTHRFHADSVSRTLELVGEKWTPLILRDAFFGVRRYEELARNLTPERGPVHLAAPAARP